MGHVRRYVEQFDQAAMLEMTRVVSAEGAQLVEAQTAALFGDLKALQRQMQARGRMGWPDPAGTFEFIACKLFLLQTLLSICQLFLWCN